MKKEPSKSLMKSTQLPDVPPLRTLTAEQKAQIEALSALPDEAINTDDIPEVKDWSGARRGVFYRPVKQQITLRLDADLIDWFKRHHPEGEGYQTSINRALREYVEDHQS